MNKHAAKSGFPEKKTPFFLSNKNHHNDLKN